MKNKENADLFALAALVQRARLGNTEQLAVAENAVEKIKSDIKFQDAQMRKKALSALLANATCVMRQSLSFTVVQQILERYLKEKESIFFLDEKELYLTITSWSTPEIKAHTPPELVRYGESHSSNDFHIAIQLKVDSKKIVWHSAEVYYYQRTVNQLNMEAWSVKVPTELQPEFLHALLYMQTQETCMQLLAQRFYLSPTNTTDPI